MTGGRSRLVILCVLEYDAAFSTVKVLPYNIISAKGTYFNYYNFKTLKQI